MLSTLYCPLGKCVHLNSIRFRISAVLVAHKIHTACHRGIDLHTGHANFIVMSANCLERVRVFRVRVFRVRVRVFRI